MKAKCQLCDLDLTAEWNTPLMETSNFIVLPSLGALVEGWVLIVPKDHFLSMAELPDTLIPEMQNLKVEVWNRLRDTYGSISAFEHGPGEERRRVGCGVDHAHLHVVPADFDLSDAVAPYLPLDSCWSAATLTILRAAVTGGDDYLYLEQPLGNAKMIRHWNLGSQAFRRAIAAHLRVPGQFDWRSFPQLENVRRTIRSFEAGLKDGLAAVSEHAA